MIFFNMQKCRKVKLLQFFCIKIGFKFFSLPMQKHFAKVEDMFDTLPRLPRSKIGGRLTLRKIHQ